MNKVFAIFCLQLLEFTFYASKAKELGPIWVFILVNECLVINNILNTLTAKEFLLSSHPLRLLEKIVWQRSMSYNGSTFMTATYKVGIRYFKEKKSKKNLYFWVRRKSKWLRLFRAFKKWCCSCCTIGTADSEFM